MPPASPTPATDIPGVISPARRAPYVLAAAVMIGTVLGAGAVAGPAVAAPSRPAGRAPGPAVAGAAGAGAPEWLREINAYRRAAGISAVTANPAWIRGIKNHLRYMADTPRKYLTGRYASLHTENPKSPYYTRSGAKEAASSDLFEGAVGFTARQFIDGWLSSPFHAIGMLRVDLRQLAFASSAATGDAGLDVLSGLTGTASPRLVRFPGPGMTTTLLTYSGDEEPDPLQTCRWSDGRRRGLPIIALLPTAPEKHLTATLRSSTTGRESTAKGTICMLDEHHYRSTDKLYGPTGLAILRADRAVVLIPTRPLVKGTYQVTISQPGRPSITWSFSAARSG